MPRNYLETLTLSAEAFIKYLIMVYHDTSHDFFQNKGSFIVILSSKKRKMVGGNVKRQRTDIPPSTPPNQLQLVIDGGPSNEQGQNPGKQLSPSWVPGSSEQRQIYEDMLEDKEFFSKFSKFLKDEDIPICNDPEGCLNESIVISETFEVNGMSDFKGGPDDYPEEFSHFVEGVKIFEDLKNIKGEGSKEQIDNLTSRIVEEYDLNDFTFEEYISYPNIITDVKKETDDALNKINYISKIQLLYHMFYSICLKHTEAGAYDRGNVLFDRELLNVLDEELKRKMSDLKKKLTEYERFINTLLSFFGQDRNRIDYLLPKYSPGFQGDMREQNVSIFTKIYNANPSINVDEFAELNGFYDFLEKGKEIMSDNRYSNLTRNVFIDILGLEETVSTDYDVDIFWNKLLDKFYNQGIEFYSELRLLYSSIELNRPEYTSTKQEIKAHLGITPASGGGVQSGGARVDPKILKHIENQKMELIYMVARVKLWDRNIDSLIVDREPGNVMIDGVKYNRGTFLQLYKFEEYLNSQSMAGITPDVLTERIKNIMYIRGSSSAQNEIDIIKKNLLKFVKYTCIPNLLEGGGEGSTVYATNFRLDLTTFLKARIKYILKHNQGLITRSNVLGVHSDTNLNDFLTGKFFGKKKKIINTEQSNAVILFGKTLMTWCGYYIESLLLPSLLPPDYTLTGWFQKELKSMKSGTVSDEKLKVWMLSGTDGVLPGNFSPNKTYKLLSTGDYQVMDKPLSPTNAGEVRRLAESIYNDKLFGNNAANIPNYSEETRLNERATKGKLMEGKDRVNFNIVNIADPAPGTNWRNPITRNGHVCRIEVEGKTDTYVEFKYTNGGERDEDIEKQITLKNATLYYQVNILGNLIHRQDNHLGGGTGIRVFDGSDNNLSKQRTIEAVFRYLGSVYGIQDLMEILDKFNKKENGVNGVISFDEIAKNVMGIFMRKQFGDGGQELFMLQYLLNGKNAALVGNDWPSYCRLLFLIDVFKDRIDKDFIVGFWGVSTLHMVTSNIDMSGGGKKRTSRRTSRRKSTRRSRKTSRKTIRRSRKTSRRKSTRRSRKTTRRSRRKTTRRSRKTTRRSRRTSRKR
jgi:hypothetical protein